MPDPLPAPALPELTTAAIREAQAGDETAFRELYRALSPRLLNYIRALVGEADSEDVAAETWAAIARALPGFTGDTDGFRAWTTTIARNRALDHLRRRRPVTAMPTHELPIHASPDDTARDAVDAVSTTTALRMITALPPDQARAVLLQIIVGLDSPTAAGILGKKPDSIRTATHRGLRNLARRLHHPAPLPRDVAPSSTPRPREAG